MSQRVTRVQYPLSGRESDPLRPRQTQLATFYAAIARVDSRSMSIARSRHEQTHTNNKPYVCSQCDRRFGRQDSLLRHVRLTHRADRVQASTPSPGGTSEILQGNVDTTDPSIGRLPPLARSSLPPGGIAATTEAGSMMSAGDLVVTTDGQTLNNGTLDQSAVPQGEVNDPSQATGSFAFDGNGNWDRTHQSDPYNPLVNVPQLSDENLLSFNGIWDLLSQDLLPNSRSLHAAPRFLAELGLEMDPLFQKAPAYDHAQSSSNHSDTPRSTTSSFFLDRRDYEGPVLPADGVEAGARGDFALSMANAIASRMSTTLRPMISPLSSELLALCLSMFWTRIWPTYPIIHPSTFNLRETSAPLLINIIALGSLALQNKDVQLKGTSLWRLVNRNITTSWDQLIEIRGRYDPCKGINLIQTLVTGLLFASASSDPSVVNQACMTLANGLRWARIAGMLSPEVINQNLTPTPDQLITPLQLDMRWRQWAVLEDLKRSITTIHLLDCTFALATESPCIARHLVNPCGCVWDDETAYSAVNAEQWKASIEANRTSVPPLTALSTADLYQYFFSEDPSSDVDLGSIPMMTRQTLLAGLASLIIDANQSQHGSFDLGRTDLASIGRALIHFYTVFLHQTSDPRSVSVLLGHWHHTAIMLGYAIAKHNGWLKDSLWHSPLGRHLLLHANSIRQISENIRLVRTKVPHLIQLQIIESGAFVFRDYVAACKDQDRNMYQQQSVRRYSLNREIDWERLNRAIGICYSIPTRAGDVPSLSSPEEDFIKRGNISPVINGLSVGNQDLGPFITVLVAIGRTHPRAEEIAFQLEQSVRFM
ncbi:hypothetical protein C345_00120 [Cryptococcus neoformans A2-102-5]|nr:hypothetical protein C346_07096 [Cryptococcus neoformans var. grubii D17-1]OXG94028.1 hypothetical protein C345_04682 [Cryptococcus neoformans var. grubii A2-102-5]OXG99887.1 hypothetical protein C345_00120 [Cryptococcus neoformans var. grubii A2-102-5]